MNDPTPEKVSDVQTGQTDRLACPDCGVVQRVSWRMAKYENDSHSYDAPYVDDECAVCGFDDVWV